MLVHFDYTCQLRGPRCTLVATTVHHLLPSSQAPDLFWEPSNLNASCPACNYSDGASIAAANRRQRREDLLAVIAEQEQRIAHLLERLAHFEDAERAKRQQPAIY